MHIRKVFNKTWTIAGWPHRWYPVKGTPYISRFASYSHLQSISDCRHRFHNRSQAMYYIKMQIDWEKAKAEQRGIVLDPHNAETPFYWP